MRIVSSCRPRYREIRVYRDLRCVWRIRFPRPIMVYALNQRQRAVHARLLRRRDYARALAIAKGWK